MDPSARLPPEVRECILSNLLSITSISRLTRASPTVLAQYMVSKTYLITDSLINLLRGHLYNEILQDALAVIRIDIGTISPDNHVIRYWVEQWVSKSYPDPFEEKDHGTIIKLHRLLSRLGMFVEDYVSKGTSSTPSEAFLCLPTIGHQGRGLEYRSHIFKPNHVTLDELKHAERQKLLWSFTRYEILCKTHSYRMTEVMGIAEHHALIVAPFYDLSLFEQEFLNCVREYVETIYGALFARSAVCVSPPVSRNVPGKAAVPERLLYPDNLYFDPLRAYKDLEASFMDSREGLDLSYALPGMGFDLLTRLLVYADKTSSADIRDWFYSISLEWCGPRFPDGSDEHFLGYGPKLEFIYTDPDKSQRYQLLQILWLFHMDKDDMAEGTLRRAYPDMYLQRMVYRQRAWPFFDDARLFPGADVQNHFPSIQTLNKQYAAVNQELPQPERRNLERGRLRMLQYYRCGVRQSDGVKQGTDDGSVIQNDILLPWYGDYRAPL
ncbi:hypothetical protein FGRMN_651 [Fusarium graminum]|nr:hypothetical protein FGRMN_651 [Fusarium graminum]